MARINCRACTLAQQKMCAQLPYDTCPFACSSSLDANTRERLGRAWCNLNCWRWDDLCGPKPQNWDQLPAFSSDRLSKYDIGSPILHLIESLIGAAGCSRAWWLYELGQTEEEWKQWWEKENKNEPNRNL